jgi:cytochrome c oxidase subunit IV
MSDVSVHADAHDAREHDHHAVNYMAKFWWLVGLTVTEVGVAVASHKVAGFPGWLTLALLAGLAGWKAGIVLNHFMHLKQENRAMHLVVAFPAALIVVLVTLFLMDGYFLHRGF